MNTSQRFLTIDRKTGRVCTGIVTGLDCQQIDLETKQQSITTNPATSVYDEHDGIKWEPMSATTEEGSYICDDDDGMLWYRVPRQFFDGEEQVDQIDLIHEEICDVCINLDTFQYYHKNTKTWQDIAGVIQTISLELENEQQNDRQKSWRWPKWLISRVQR